MTALVARRWLTAIAAIVALIIVTLNIKAGVRRYSRVTAVVTFWFS